MHAAQKLLFVVNPNSGGSGRTDYEPLIQEYFKPLPHKISFYLLTGKNDAEQIKQHIADEQPEKVVAVGGDGTVNLVAAVLAGTPQKMAIIPAGSANGMARDINMPTAFNDLMDLLLNGVARPTDIIKINGKDICLHLSDIGLNARLIKYFELGNMRGKLGYAKVALKVLWQRQHIYVAIRTANEVIKREAFMVVLANASRYGTGAVINPEGSLYDGFFEVVIIRQLAVFEIIKMWFKPKPFDRRKIEIIKGCTVHITTNRRVHFQVDGEYKGKVKQVKAEIMPGVLNLVVPQSSER